MDHKQILEFFERHGVDVLEIELGPTVPPHIGKLILQFGIFDGFALAIADNGPQVATIEPQYQYIKLVYPKLADIKSIEEYGDRIREYQFANHIEVDCELFKEDGAMSLSTVHDITKADFEYSLKAGLAQLGKCPKHLHIFEDEDDFYCAFDGSIHAVADATGKYLCDLYEEELDEFLDSGEVFNSLSEPYPKAPSNESDIFLNSLTDEDRVYNARIEIIRLTR